MASRGAVRLDRAAVAVWLSHLVGARSLGLRKLVGNSPKFDPSGRTLKLIS